MRILAGLISFGRFLFGVAFLAEPKLMERAWIGKQARLPGAQLLARAVGARDFALGLGGLQAVTRNDGSARPWLAAAAVCDAVDFGATWAAGRAIPSQARTGVLAIAGVSSLLSAVTAAGVPRPRASVNTITPRVAPLGYRMRQRRNEKAGRGWRAEQPAAALSSSRRDVNRVSSRRSAASAERGRPESMPAPGLAPREALRGSSSRRAAAPRAAPASATPASAAAGKPECFRQRAACVRARDRPSS